MAYIIVNQNGKESSETAKVWVSGSMSTRLTEEES
jgi:hypothetical protein